MKRAVWLAAVLLLAADVAPIRADMPAGSWPWSKRPERPWGGYGAPPAGWYDSKAGQPTPTEQPKPEPPKASAPFRSCGSGAPLALAGIGATWGMLWLGNRFAGRMSRRESR